MNPEVAFWCTDVAMTLRWQIDCIKNLAIIGPLSDLTARLGSVPNASAALANVTTAQIYQDNLITNYTTTSGVFISLTALKSAAADTALAVRIVDAHRSRTYQGLPRLEMAGNWLRANILALRLALQALDPIEKLYRRKAKALKHKCKGLHATVTVYAAYPGHPAEAGLLQDTADVAAEAQQFYKALLSTSPLGFVSTMALEQGVRRNDYYRAVLP